MPDRRRKLTDAQVADVQRLLDMGVTQARVARDMGVSVKAVRCAVDAEFRARDSAASSRRQMERYRNDPAYRQQRIDAAMARHRMLRAGRDAGRAEG